MKISNSNILCLESEIKRLNSSLELRVIGTSNGYKIKVNEAYKKDFDSDLMCLNHCYRYLKGILSSLAMIENKIRDNKMYNTLEKLNEKGDHIYQQYGI